MILRDAGDRRRIDLPGQLVSRRSFASRPGCPRPPGGALGGSFVSSTLNRLPQVSVRPDRGWIMILEQAAIEVFEMMAGARLEPLPTSEEQAAGDRTALVGMAGALCGMTTIRCSSAVAAKLAGRMLGGTPPHKLFDGGRRPRRALQHCGGSFQGKIPQS
jgi:hypothetical protein